MKQIAPTALLLSLLAQAQGTNAPYASMAPLDQYLIADRNAEISLAKSAALHLARSSVAALPGRDGLAVVVVIAIHTKTHRGPQIPREEYCRLRDLGRAGSPGIIWLGRRHHLYLEAAADSSAAGLLYLTSRAVRIRF
jgi:hypothetical protein